MPRLSFAILGFLSFLPLVGPIVYGVSPYEIVPAAVLLSPSLSHPFGTDLLGRDVLARTIQGASTSLMIGFVSAVITTLIGLFIGMMAAYKRGVVDKTLLVVIDLFLTFPTFFLLLALVTFIQASSWVLIIVLALTGWMGISRMIRSEAFAIAHRPYIKILRQAGMSRWKILTKYYTPLLIPLVMVNFAFAASGAILSESSLSFLGLGVMPPDMSWGSMMAEGKDVLAEGWWISFFPGFLIFLISLALINIADYVQIIANERSIIA